MKLNKFKILLLGSIFSLTSCGAFNKVFKTSDKKKENTEISISKEDNTLIEDKSHISISEKVDTIVYTKPKKINSNISISNIKDINNLVVLDNELISIKQSYDTINKVLKTDVDIKPQELIINIDKITNINNNIKTATNSKVDSTFKEVIVEKHKEKIKEPINITWYIILAVSSLATLYFINKYFISKKP